MFNIFRRDPLKTMFHYRDRADRAGITFLERHAVKGTINRKLVESVADAINRDMGFLVRMVPDRRRERRYTKAMAGLRNAGLLHFAIDDVPFEERLAQ